MMVSGTAVTASCYERSNLAERHCFELFSVVVIAVNSTVVPGRRVPEWLQGSAFPFVVWKVLVVSFATANLGGIYVIVRSIARSGKPIPIRKMQSHLRRCLSLRAKFGRFLESAGILVSQYSHLSMFSVLGGVVGQAYIRQGLPWSVYHKLEYVEIVAELSMQSSIEEVKRNVEYFTKGKVYARDYQTVL